ncbi:MAG: hypothetical protein CV089_08075 [Nitrospira sp. WS110]|nr:hypothetical protein [Nitrospira sp. WS110]
MTKYYDNGKPLYQSTGKLEQREAPAVLRRAENRVLEGLREGPLVYRMKFEDLAEDHRDGQAFNYILYILHAWLAGWLPANGLKSRGGPSMISVEQE